MKIVRVVAQYGQVIWGRTLDQQSVEPLIGDLYGVHRFDTAPVRFVRRMAPVEPPNIFAIGRNYPEHAREMGAGSVESEPLIFIKATSSIIGPDDEIVLPPSAPDEVDFEAELAVVIGSLAKDVDETQAMLHILGFTCANDISARDCQKRRDKQWARGKSFDTFCPVGPALITADAINPDSVAIRSRLNGEVMQESSTREMIFSVARLVSYLSRQFSLLPGTLILTGTPSGVGAARTPPRFLRPGDKIDVEIEGIGVLSNVVRGPETSRLGGGLPT